MTDVCQSVTYRYVTVYYSPNILFCVGEKTGLSNMYGRDGPFIISPTPNNIFIHMASLLRIFLFGMKARDDVMT